MFLNRIVTPDEFIAYLDERVKTPKSLVNLLKKMWKKEQFFINLPSSVLFNTIFKYSNYNELYIEILKGYIKYHQENKILSKYEGYNIIEFIIHLQLKYNNNNYNLYYNVIELLKKNSIHLNYSITPTNLTIVGLVSKSYHPKFIKDNYYKFLKHIIKVDKHLFYLNNDNIPPNIKNILFNNDYLLLSYIYEIRGFDENICNFLKIYENYIINSSLLYIFMRDQNIFKYIMQNYNLKEIDLDKLKIIKKYNSYIYNHTLYDIIDNLKRSKENNYKFLKNYKYFIHYLEELRVN